MRREPTAAAAASAVAAMLAVAAPVRADVRALVAADSYLATTPGLATDNAADVAWSAHVEWRGDERGATLDWVERESLIGGAARRELHELAYVERSIEHLALTVGRFRVPGGFWLIADGGAVAARWGELELGVFGGSRSFTNGRAETLLTSSPRPIPLAGAALTTRGDVRGALSYTYTADRVVLYRGDGTTASSTQPEQFVDAEVFAPLGDDVLVTGGATAGSRYLVTYPTTAGQIVDDPRLENVWFGSQSVYALADWRLGDWRLDASAAAIRTKLGQTTAAPTEAPEAMALAALSGSYVEGTLRATWRRERQWRVDGRYRARVWGDHRHAHRAQVTAEWRRGALDLQAGAGLDVHRNPDDVPGLVDSRTLLYRASVGRKTAGSELAVGAAAVAAIGDEVSAGPGGDAGDQRAPYTLEARSYAFVRAFATRGAWFGGLDGELSLRGDGARALLQIGCSR
jgi:hypothetical protein